jgi:hypothetical protein
MQTLGLRLTPVLLLVGRNAGVKVDHFRLLQNSRARTIALPSRKSIVSLIAQPPR